MWILSFLLPLWLTAIDRVTTDSQRFNQRQLLDAEGLGQQVNGGLFGRGGGVLPRLVCQHPLAVFGCLLGVLAEVVFAPRRVGTSIMDVIGSLTLEEVIAIYQYALGYYYLVAWAVASWVAWILAKRRLSREEGLAVYMYELRGRR